MVVNGNIFGVLVIIHQVKLINTSLVNNQFAQHRWLWASSYQQKHKVFYWLILKNRLNTRGLLKRKNMLLESYDCELCMLHKKDKLRHIFYICPFAKSCWNLIGIIVDLAKTKKSNKEHQKITKSAFCNRYYYNYVLVYLD
jgi:hypothetical protein